MAKQRGENMSHGKAPIPTVMPVDREKWAKQLSLSNFINTYFQYRDLQNLGDPTDVLIVGPGQGLDKIVLEWRGFHVTTFDIDSSFSPDHIGSVHDLNMFSSGLFDVVIASHVLEHLAVPYLKPALKEIARVGRYALIYLPVHGKHLQWRFMTSARRLDLSFILDIYNFFRKPNGIAPRYSSGQHFWEVGMRGFKVKDMKRRFLPFFNVMKVYRNREWLPSMNFVLKSKLVAD
jgi:hypothetical protein